MTRDGCVGFHRRLDTGGRVLEVGFTVFVYGLRQILWCRMFEHADRARTQTGSAGARVRDQGMQVAGSHLEVPAASVMATYIRRRRGLIARIVRSSQP